MSWTLAALVEASGRGLTTSTDLHDWDGDNAHHRPFAYAADLVFMSGSRLAGVEDAVAADVLDRGRARVVVVMDGAQGSRVTARGGRGFAVPALEVTGRPVVDSNGAGDAYVSGFLTAWLAGEDPRRRPVRRRRRSLGVRHGRHAHEFVGPDGWLPARPAARVRSLCADA